MNKLPNLYKNKFNKKINNNKEICYVEEISNYNKLSNIENTLRNVQTGLGSDYNTRVIIETNDKVYDTTLVYKTKNEVITEENNIININDIKNIEIKK